MIRRVGVQPKKRIYWHRKFVWLAFIRVEDDDRTSQTYSLVILQTLERRYSQSSGGYIWRVPA